MSKEKQIENQAIEEMAKDVTRSISWCNEEVPCVDCLGTAALLYAKGYRKQSEGEWRMVSDYADSRIVECSKCDKQFYFKKKGQLNIDKMPYCPNCGARMKGGD